MCMCASVLSLLLGMFGFHKSEFSFLPSILKTGSDFLLQIVSLLHISLDKCKSLSSCPSPFPSRLFLSLSELPSL